ncbi:MAG: methionyl-tRNA formyltransferase [Actinomycetota bacterium]|nr:methionyl-tRNA formyltransferase [Actinomycetota bacterium]
MRLVFLGSPADALPSLQALHDGGHDIALVVTQPDRRRGRGGGTEPSPVKRLATELGLPVVTPGRCIEVLDDIAGSGATLGVVVAFGQLIPPAVLDALPQGYVNVHFSLLPRWRGAAPVERAVMAGDAETGVCLMRLEAGLDTGPVYAVERVAIDPEETAGELRARLVTIGTDLLVSRLEDIPKIDPVPQEGEPTYAAKLTTEEFQLDLAAPAVELARLVRAGNPKPGAWTSAAGRRLKVLRARAEPASATASPGELVGPARVATGDGILVLKEVQPETKGVMAGAAWAAGFRGPRLGD